jgi:phosphoadenosine phosphosulfate reductase
MATADLVSPAALAAANEHLARMTAQERIGWAMDQFPGEVVLSTSFGAQAAVMLSLAVQAEPDIPVILVDTGYLFPETYRFADQLKARLNLNLHVYRPELSAAWFEARHGRLWEQGPAGLAEYNRQAKVEPMERALRDLEATAWLAGLRRSQATSRQELPIVGQQNGRVKVLPIVDWTDRDVFQYLTDHDLPYHPLWDEGYVSIGDTHSTRPLTAELTAEQTRFFGLKRECGLHDTYYGAMI